MPLTEQRVVDRLGAWLTDQGFVVASVPIGRRGTDIVAQRADPAMTLAIEAKGGSHAGSEASKHAFVKVAEAFMTAAAWLHEAEPRGDRFAIAVPKSNWFDKHVERIRPAAATLGVYIFQVADDGSVEAKGFD